MDAPPSQDVFVEYVHHPVRVDEQPPAFVDFELRHYQLAHVVFPVCGRKWMFVEEHLLQHLKRKAGH